jgi:hypothetical protein
MAKSDAERPWQHHQEAVAVNGRTEQVAWKTKIDDEDCEAW